MELLESVTWPKPLEELLDAAFEIYRAGHPWVADHELSPKSVARDMYERAMTFGEYVNFYALTRSEGLLLRYLSDASKALRQTVPDSVRTEEIVDLTEWLGELVRQVDSSLLDEWEALRNPDDDEDPLTARPPTPTGPPPVTANKRAFKVLVRNAMFRRVELFAKRLWNDLAALDAERNAWDADRPLGEVRDVSEIWDADRWADAIEDYYEEFDTLSTGPDARGPKMLIIEELADRWRVRQIFDDPAGDHDWGISAEVDFEASNEAGTAVIRITEVGQL